MVGAYVDKKMVTSETSSIIQGKTGSMFGMKLSVETETKLFFFFHKYV